MTAETAKLKQLADSLKDVNESFRSLQFAISCVQHIRHPSDFDLHERLNELETVQNKINEEIRKELTSASTTL